MHTVVCPEGQQNTTFPVCWLEAAAGVCEDYINISALVLPAWTLGPAVLILPDTSTTVQASLGNILRCHCMALQCKQSQDIVKYTQVPIFSKSRTDLYIFTTLNSDLGTFAETQAGDYRLVLQEDACEVNWALACVQYLNPGKLKGLA